MKKNNKFFISFVILTLFIFFLLLLFFLNKSLENFDSKKKIWAMTYGGGEKNYYDAVDRIKNELNNTKIFDEIITFSDIDLKNDTIFWKKHNEFIENNKRGNGYWLWKPYLIMKTLEMMNENDILFHLDAGCEITDYSENAINDFKKMIEKCEKNYILYTNTDHNEKMYTKMDIFKHMDLIDENIMNSQQHQATLIIIKKTNIITEFIKDWYNISCNYNLIDDSDSINKNDNSFIDNRHTQSTFSLLLKTQKYQEKLNTDNNIINGYPIILSRKRHG